MTSRWKYFVVFALAAAPLAAQRGFNGPGQYQITNLKSGKVLDLDMRNRTSVIQFDARGTDNQVWVVRPGPDGFFYLRNRMNGFALDAGGGGRSEPVRAVPFNGGPSQQWRFEAGKDGNPLITSRLGRTLDIPDGTSRNGAFVQVYDPNGDSNQRFILQRVQGGGFLDWDRDQDRDRNRDRDRDGDRGDRGRDFGRDERRLTCSSNHGERVYCELDTRGVAIDLARQISGSPCRMGETWGWDRRGIWVDRGCRAEFSIRRR